MGRARKLDLNRETVRELRDGEIGAVAAAAQLAQTKTGPNLNYCINICVGRIITQYQCV
jgi:hypothetical protein